MMWNDTGGHSIVDYVLMALFVAVTVWVVIPGGLASRTNLFDRGSGIF